MKSTNLPCLLGLAMLSLMFTSCETTPPPPPPTVTVYEVKPTPPPSPPRRTPAPAPTKTATGGYSGSAEGFVPVERPSTYSN